MSAHVRRENGGTNVPPGLRLSWQAIAAMLALLALLGSTAGFVRSLETRNIDVRIDTIEDRLCREETDRKAQRVDLERRLDRMDQKLDMIWSELRKRNGH